MRVLILILLLIQGSAYTAEISSTGYAVITQEVMITADTTDPYTYYIPFPIDHLEVYADKTVRGEFAVVGRYTEITLHVLEEAETVYCICEYYTWEITYKEGTQWYVHLLSMEEAVTVVMPKGASISYLVTGSDFPSVSEENGRIHLFWEYLPDEVFIYYELSFEEDNLRYYLAIPVVVGVIGVGAALIYIRRRKSQKLSDAVLSVLNEREKKIVEYLHTKGRSRQAKISRECQIPKTSLSKILIKMEERGIVKREKDGNLTFCELDEKVYQ
jgi:uncharacterized membrane protein